MKRQLSRREFSLAAGLGLGALRLAGQATPPRRLKIGHTGITWGYQPADAERAIKDIGSQGFYGFESFGNVIESWEAQPGGIGKILDENKLPLISAYCGMNLTDAAQRTAEVQKMVRWATLIKKYGGTTAVIGPNSVRRNTYDFNAAKPNIVATLNDTCKALADIGMIGVLHQHTGTCVEVRDEVYAVLDAVDPKVVRFGPDVGQLAKGGSDPVKVVKDYLPLIRHVHLNELDGRHCGAGDYDYKPVLEALRRRNYAGWVSLEAFDFTPGAERLANESLRHLESEIAKLPI